MQQNFALIFRSLTVPNSTRGVALPGPSVPLTRAFVPLLGLFSVFHCRSEPRRHVAFSFQGGGFRPLSETGRIWFRRVRFQTPNSVSFSGLTEFRGANWVRRRTQWVPLSLLCVCQSELTEFLAELTEFAAELSEFSLPKQYPRNSIPPVPHTVLDTLSVGGFAECTTSIVFHESFGGGSQSAASDMTKARPESWGAGDHKHLHRKTLLRTCRVSSQHSLFLRSPNWGLFLSWNSCVHGGFLQPFPKSVLTVKCYSNTKNGR